jgi:predicted nucleic acid-binding Zn ribbon protein
MGDGFLLDVDGFLEVGNVKWEDGKCIRCSRTLKVRGVHICDECADEVNSAGTKRRRNLFASFFFHLAALVFVYLYFFRGLPGLYQYLFGG